MNIELAPGEKLTVTLKDTDGEFVIEYGEREVSVNVDLPDSDGRKGCIYSERFMEAFEATQKGLREANSTPTAPYDNEKDWDPKQGKWV